MNGFSKISARRKINLIFTSILLVFIAFEVFAITYVMQRTGELSILLTLLAIGIPIFIISMHTLLLRHIAAPARQMADSAKNLARGAPKSDAKYEEEDEFGRTAAHLAHVAAELTKLREEQYKLEQKLRRREFGGRMEAESFAGEFKDVAASTNGIISGLESEISNLADFMQRFDAGELPRGMGLGARSSHMIVTANLAATLREIATETQSMAQAAAAGDFRKRLDAAQFHGEWKKLANSMNMLMEALDAPISQARAAMEGVAAGKFDAKVSADAKGELLRLKGAANNAMAALTKYTKTMADALENISQKSRHLPELPGDLEAVKSAIARLNASMRAEAPRQRSNVAPAVLMSMTSPTVDRYAPPASFHKKFSGARRVDDTKIGGRDTPDYMKPDFGKY